MYNAHLLKIAIIVQIFATSVIAQESTVEKAKEVLVMNVMGEQSLIGQTAPELDIEKYLQAPEGEKSLSAIKGQGCRPGILGNMVRSLCGRNSASEPVKRGISR